MIRALMECVSTQHHAIGWCCCCFSWFGSEHQYTSTEKIKYLVVAEMPQPAHTHTEHIRT